VVSVVDVATGAVTPAVSGFGWPYRVLFSPDASLVLLPDLRGETLRFVDRTTRAELHRMALPGKAPQGITFTPNGRFVFLSYSAVGQVAMIDVAARRVIAELSAGDTPDGVVYTTRVVAP
jgi:DNA-binding beta-propeller fold protein YncE